MNNMQDFDNQVNPSKSKLFFVWFRIFSIAVCGFIAKQKPQINLKIFNLK